MEQKPKVTTRLAIPPEVTTEYVGTKLGDFYSRADISLQTQKDGREIFLSLYGEDIGAPSVPTPAYIGVSAFGADLVLPEDHPPMVMNQGHVLEDDAAIMSLEPAQPEKSVWMCRYLEMRDEMSAMLGKKLAISAGQEGPITSAVLLRGDRFYQDIIEAPERAHHLLSVVTDTYINFVQYCRCASDQPLHGSSGIADDLAGTLSPRMWPEFVVPYWTKIYESLGPGSRSVHTELLRPAHLHYLTEMKINHYDPGNDQYLEVDDVVAGIGNMAFSWNLYTVRDMLNGTPDTIRATFHHAVAAGAREIMCELCRRTPRENVMAFVEAGREYKS